MGQASVLTDTEIRRVFRIIETTRHAERNLSYSSAVPLPPTAVLFATGLAALGVLGWHRKRKNVAAIAAA